MPHRIAACAALLLAIGAALVMPCSGGCSREDDRPAAEARGAPKKQEAERIDEAALREVIRRRAGRVVLVDFWATWCAPCVEAFPEVIRWQEQYSQEGLTVISVSLDLPADHEKVIEFLAERQPPFRAYHLQVADFNEFVKSFAPQWGGSIPAVVMFGRDGRRRHVLEGAEVSAEAEEKLRQMLVEG